MDLRRLFGRREKPDKVQPDRPPPADEPKPNRPALGPVAAPWVRDQIGKGQALERRARLEPSENGVATEVGAWIDEVTAFLERSPAGNVAARHLRREVSKAASPEARAQRAVKDLEHILAICEAGS